MGQPIKRLMPFLPAQYPLILSYAIPLIIFLAGCSLHYQRGYYSPEPVALHAHGADDAYISYRYGWNLAHFHTLSWNESGYRRTEGFTDPLWVYLSAGWSLMGSKDALYPLMTVTSVLISAILLWMLIGAVRAANEGETVSTLGLVLVAASPVVWLHTTSGIESGVFGCGLALAAYLAIFSDREQQGTLLIALSIFLCLLRSDGFIYVAAIIAGAIIAGSRLWKYLSIGLALSMLLLLGWRLLTFGAWLPNTAIAKLNFGLEDRLPYGFSILAGVLLYGGLLVFVLLGLIGLTLKGTRCLLGGATVILLWLSYFVYIGGDHFLERHLLHTMFLGAAFSAPLWRRLKVASRVLVMVVALLAVLLPILQKDPRFAYTTPKLADPWIAIGKAMARDRARFGVLITHPAGKIPFFAGGDVIDEFGLNDSTLAQVKRERFYPGHSSGGFPAALQIVQAHPSGIYSLYAFFDRKRIPGPDAVALWINNRHPQQEAQTTPTQQEWDEALATGDPFIWSIISTPIRIGP